MIPDKPGRKLPQELRFLHGLLKKLPDDFQVWFPHGGMFPQDRPQVLVVWREKYGFLIQVADTTQRLAETVMQGELFQRPETILIPGDLASKETSTLNAFVAQVIREQGLAEGGLRVRRMVVFPNVRSHTIDEIVLMRGREEAVTYQGLRELDPGEFRRRLEALADEALPPPVISRLRARMHPESLVPARFNARATVERSDGRELTPAFLDFDQEWCVKNDLELLPEQEESLESRARLVTGVAGSGKSLVLLYRAVLFARENPRARCLLLTHNKALILELERRMASIGGDSRRIECRTFMSWAKTVVGGFTRCLRPEQTRAQLARLKRGIPGLEDFSDVYLADEIGWIKDQGITRKSIYLCVQRTGRGRATRPGVREAVWKLFKTYQEHLRDSGLTDWHNLALKFHRKVVVRGIMRGGRYDAIFIDEAQFFATTWLETVRAALQPGGQLFLAADPTQGFLRRRQSWISAGIQIAGRTTRLKTAYRNTRAILEFARDFYQQRLSEDDEDDLNVPDDETLSSIPVPGVKPLVVHVSSPQDELAQAVRWVRELTAMPAGRMSVLLIDAVGDRLRDLRRLIGEEKCHIASEDRQPDASRCLLASINQATGLEAPAVIVIGMDPLLAGETDPTLSADDLMQLRRDNTRRLYMAFTRAGQRLMVTRLRSLPLTVWTAAPSCESGA
jgi:hypothetical protein